MGTANEMAPFSPDQRVPWANEMRDDERHFWETAQAKIANATPREAAVPNSQRAHTVVRRRPDERASVKSRTPRTTPREAARPNSTRGGRFEDQNGNKAGAQPSNPAADGMKLAAEMRAVGLEKDAAEVEKLMRVVQRAMQGKASGKELREAIDNCRIGNMGARQALVRKLFDSEHETSAFWQDASKKMTEQDSLVVVHVYDLLPTYLNAMAGVYHTGIEVQGREYNFGENGVWVSRPRECGIPGAVHRESITIGRVSLTELEVGKIMERYEVDWANCYDLVGRNCNDFCDALCRELVGCELPRWINRTANVGAFLAHFTGYGPKGKYCRDNVKVELPNGESNYVEDRAREIQSRNRCCC